MDPRKYTPVRAPEYIDWPGKGIANKLPIRGMSDYVRGAGNPFSANYITSNGIIILFRDGIRWQIQHKGITTKWFPTLIEAISNFESRQQI